MKAAQISIFATVHRSILENSPRSRSGVRAHRAHCRASASTAPSRRAAKGPAPATASTTSSVSGGTPSGGAEAPARRRMHTAAITSSLPSGALADANAIREPRASHGRALVQRVPPDNISIYNLRNINCCHQLVALAPARIEFRKRARERQ